MLDGHRALLGGPRGGERFDPTGGERAEDLQVDVLRCGERSGRLVDERRTGADVEARFVAVAGERGVAPLAVELVGAEDEGRSTVAPWARWAVMRVAVVEVAGLGVAGGKLDARGRRRG